jgi:hypothetical protein
MADPVARGRGMRQKVAEAKAQAYAELDVEADHGD